MILLQSGVDAVQFLTFESQRNTEVTSPVDKNGYFPKPCVVLCVVNMEKVPISITDKIRARTFHLHFGSKVLLNYKKNIWVQQLSTKQENGRHCVTRNSRALCNTLDQRNEYLYQAQAGNTARVGMGNSQQNVQKSPFIAQISNCYYYRYFISFSRRTS